MLTKKREKNIGLMSIAAVFDGFIPYMESNMEMCIKIFDQIWRLHALFSVTDVTLNWAAVNFIKSAFHPELYYMAHLHRLELIISDLNPFWLAVIVRISHGYAWILLKQNGMGPFFCVYTFSHFSNAQQQCFRYVIFWGNVNICIHQYLSREKKNISDIVVRCLLLYDSFFPFNNFVQPFYFQ